MSFLALQSSSDELLAILLLDTSVPNYSLASSQRTNAIVWHLRSAGTLKSLLTCGKERLRGF